MVIIRVCAGLVVRVSGKGVIGGVDMWWLGVLTEAVYGVVAGDWLGNGRLVGADAVVEIYELVGELWRALVTSLVGRVSVRVARGILGVTE